MLKGKVLLITGASRGIGLAIGIRAAKDGACVALLAKTTTPHPQLPGTIYTAAEEIEKAGGKALPILCDIRDENQVQKAVAETVAKFGGIDICVNNASAISLKGTENTPMKRFDLMQQINTRGTFVTTQACIPHLRQSAKKGRNPHILNISPPLNMNPRWFKDHVAYTMAKYGMSMCVLGHAEEFRSDGIAVNALWPRTGIATAAIEFIGGKQMAESCRTVDIMSDSAYIILTRPSTKCTANFFIDDEVLRSEGITDLRKYEVSPGATLMPDFFLDEQPKIASKL